MLRRISISDEWDVENLVYMLDEMEKNKKALVDYVVYFCLASCG
ncbi:MAG: hypothetical protein ACPLTR_09105 [Thermacetogeniaceae bacterium]